MNTEFDNEIDRISNATEVKPVLLSGSKTKEIKPNVIKGFCSSVSSSKSEIDEPVIQDPQIDLKYHFYNSGTGFNQSEVEQFPSPVKVTNSQNFEKSQKQITGVYKLSVDSSLEEVNKTQGVN